MVVFSSYEIEERAPYRGETIARLGALLEAARLRHRGGVGGREGVGGPEKSRSLAHLFVYLLHLSSKE